MDAQAQQKLVYNDLFELGSYYYNQGNKGVVKTWSMYICDLFTSNGSSR